MRKDSPPTALFTIPNLLSFLRLGMIPVLYCCYMKANTPQEYHFVGFLAGFSFLTDYYDGFLARKWKCSTYVGRVLDPIADKGTQFAIMFCLSMKETIFQPLLVLLVVKETLQFLAGIYYLKKKMMLKSALPAGKAATALLFISFYFLIMFPETNTNIKKILVIVNFIALSISLVSYGYTYGTGHGNYEQLSKQ